MLLRLRLGLLCLLPVSNIKDCPSIPLSPATGSLVCEIVWANVSRTSHRSIDSDIPDAGDQADAKRITSFVDWFGVSFAAALRQRNRVMDGNKDDHGWLIIRWMLTSFAPRIVYRVKLVKSKARG